MFQRKYLVSVIMSVLLCAVPLVAFADAEHGYNIGDSMAIGPLPAAFILSMIVIAVVYTVPTITVNTLQLAILGLGAMTTVIHLMVGIGGELLLLFNALGYVVLLAVLFAPVSSLISWQPLARIALLTYTLITFVAYFMLHSIEQFEILDIVTKAVEFGLMVLLVIWLLQVRNGRTASATHDTTQSA